MLFALSARVAGRTGCLPILSSMPTYEYRCTKGHSFDAFQSITDEPLTKCEVCGRPVVRVLHSPAVHFKGSGFYNTDYGTKKRQREKASSERSSSEGGGAGSTTEKATTGGDSKGSDSKGGDAKGGDSKGAAESSSKTKD
jgi:putative FmdB family regulatory protein